MSFVRVPKTAFLRTTICFIFALTYFSNISVNTSLAQGTKAPIVPIEHFAALPNTLGMSISPNGKWLSITRTINGEISLIVQEVANPKNYHFIPPKGKLDLSWSGWVNDTTMLISFAFEGNLSWESRVYASKVTRTSLLSLNVETGKLTNIIKPSKLVGSARQTRKNNMPQMQDDVVDILIKEPNHILVSIDEDQDGEDSIRKIDIRDGRFKIVFGDKRGVQNWDLDQFGNIRFGFGYDRYARRQFYFDPRTKKSIDFDLTAAHKAEMRPIAYTDDLDVVIMRQKRKDKPNRFVYYNMKTEKIEKVLYEDDEFAALGLRYAPLINENTNGSPIGIITSADDNDFIIFDEEWNNLYKSVNKALPNTKNTITSSTSDKSILIIFARNDRDPGVYYMWNRPKKQFFELDLVNTDINPNLMASMTAMSYKARDGLKIPAYLSIPLNTEPKNLPLVVMPHGGPHVRDYLGYDSFVQFLANRGYAVLQPNYRGSSQYTESFKLAGEREWGLKMQDDITDGVKHLIDQGIVDPKRVCIIGGSYGGYAALMGAVKTPDLYQCAASFNGVTHLPDLIKFDKNFIGGNVWTKSISNHETPDNQLKETSPALQAEKIKIPILLIQFKDDKRVPRRQALMMRDALKRAKKEYIYKEYLKGGHSMRTSQARIAVMTELEKFLAKHLK